MSGAESLLFIKVKNQCISKFIEKERKRSTCYEQGDINQHDLRTLKG